MVINVITYTQNVTMSHIKKLLIFNFLDCQLYAFSAHWTYHIEDAEWLQVVINKVKMCNLVQSTSKNDEGF